MLTLNAMRFYRYLYTASSFIGFFFILLNSPQRLTVLLKFAGLSHTTIFSESPFKDVCHKIENAVISSDRRGYKSVIVPYTGRVGQHKDGRHDEGKQDEGEQDEAKQDCGQHINGKLQYAMNDDTLIRWYCKCHGLKRLSLRPCSQGAFLCLTYRRAHPSKTRRGDEEPGSWQLLGSYETRTSILADMSNANRAVGFIPSYLPNGPKRREFVPWMGPFEDRGRSIETVVLEDDLKGSIIGKVESFIGAKEALLNGGHRHQLGMLWVGPPGCGKSSLVDAIAYKYGFATYTFPLGDSTLTDSELINMYLNMRPKAIAVFDDIDRVQIGEKGITENGLLKLLDGFARQGQTLLNILICNDLEKVSSVVRRKGRVDEEYHFSLASKTQVKRIFLHCNIWKPEDVKDLDLDSMAEKFAEGVPDNVVPPANIAAYIKEARTPKEAVEGVRDLVVDFGIGE